jgi:hypothetical protein
VLPGHPFVDVEQGYYWTTTLYDSPVSQTVWGVMMQIGYPKWVSKKDKHYAWSLYQYTVVT